MKGIKFLGTCLCIAVLSASAFSEEVDVMNVNLVLPKIEKSSGMSLMEALSMRKSTREFDYTKEIPTQLISELLWATTGVNRPDGKRTVGSTLNKQAVSVYAVFEKGIYLYVPEKHLLDLVCEGDFREQTGMQPFVKDAYLNLVFVGDFEKLGIEDQQRSILMLGVDAGLMSQNAYLYCASKGLGTVVRGSIDGEAFGKLLKLPPHKKVLLAQTVSWPAK